MHADLDAAFDQFASTFVREYWTVIKDGTFSMPPDEPVEESVEELIAAVSYAAEGNGARNRQEQRYTFRMTGEMGDWWMFGFECRSGAWNLLSASASSDKKNSPHDLLDSVFESYFRPLLEHVTTQANKASEQGVDPNA
jgi:hypothetical protein